MKWRNYDTHIAIIPPPEFHFGECLVFLGRSEQEVLHQIKGRALYKLLRVNEERILLQIESAGDVLEVRFPLGKPDKSACAEIAAYLWELFDLDRDLSGFYEAARHDPVLQPLAEKYRGLRIIGIPDLFEALTWAIIGQQINLAFAYTLKKRFVERFGEKLVWGGDTFWLFPDAHAVAAIGVEDLRQLSFAGRKAEYVIAVAQAMASGQLSKESLRAKRDFRSIHDALTSLRGVGAWTADYVMMKCLHQPSAFPVADAGLHQALKQRLGLARKPTIAEIMELAKNWRGWEDYATFYLWRSLL